jgi:hypothetical protein
VGARAWHNSPGFDGVVRTSSHLVSLLVAMQFYTFVICVERADASRSYIFRRYSEFNEFHSKLVADSTHKVPNFPSKIYMGRSAVRQVRAEGL